MEVVSAILIAVCIGTIPGFIAQSKGRSFVGWWLYGAALFIVALPHSLVIKADVQKLENEQLLSGTCKKCPFCAEIIKAEARVCRFCGRDLLVDERPQENEQTATARAEIPPQETQETNSGVGIAAYFVFFGLVAVILIMVGFSVTKNSGTSSTESNEGGFRMTNSTGSSSGEPTAVFEAHGYLADSTHYNVKADFKPTVMPKSRWDKFMAAAIKQRCPVEGMTRDELEKALGKPNSSEDTPDGQTLKYEKAIDGECTRFNGDACVQRNTETKTSVFYISHNGHLTYPFRDDAFGANCFKQPFWREFYRPFTDNDLGLSKKAY